MPGALYLLKHHETESEEKSSPPNTAAAAANFIFWNECSDSPHAVFEHQPYIVGNLSGTLKDGENKNNDQKKQKSDRTSTTDQAERKNHVEEAES